MCASHLPKLARSASNLARACVSLSDEIPQSRRHTETSATSEHCLQETLAWPCRRASWWLTCLIPKNFRRWLALSLAADVRGTWHQIDPREKTSGWNVSKCAGDARIAGCVKDICSARCVSFPQDPPDHSEKFTKILAPPKPEETARRSHTTEWAPVLSTEDTGMRSCNPDGALASSKKLDHVDE